MSVSVEEVKDFVEESKKARKDWLSIANRSWAELKKRKSDNRLWSITPNTVRKKSRYPLWYSIFKIRQPLILSRIGIPIVKDSTQDGSDPVGATAAILKERLAKNVAKGFDFLGSLSDSRDDFLATNFSQARVYYKCKDVKEKVKKRLQPVPVDDGQVVFIDEQENIVVSDDIGQDEVGFFVETDEVVDVEEEQVYLDSVLYTNIYVDPAVTRWRNVRELAFESSYTEAEFKEIFGAEAFVSLPKPEKEDSQTDPKKRKIKVYEYWNARTKEVKWLPEEGKDFIKPKDLILPEETEEGEEYCGLYNLKQFFPTVAEPLIMNTATNEFWPTPEYYQLMDQLEEIHSIFSKMVELTKAIRPRLFFDASVEELQSLINEAANSEAIGVTNLSTILANNGGSIENIVQYLPVEKMVAALQQMYIALEQRLNSVYKLSGTSDLLQGLVTDPTQRTFGERQMTEKYALNQIAEPQRKMAEFVRNAYDLLCETCLKVMKDKSLERLIMPATLPPEHRQRFWPALELLKSDFDRFRTELETDSTIALNEEYDKAMRVELVNAMTAALEKVAGIAQSQPALVAIELRALKFLVQGFRQGKMFQDEITTAIDNIIKQAEAAAQNPQPPPADPVMVQAQIEGQKLQAQMQIEGAKLQSNERLEVLRIQQAERLAGLDAQLQGFKQQLEMQSDAEKLQLDFAKLSSDIAATNQELQLKSQELLLEIQKAGDKKELEQLKLMLEDKVESFNAQILAAQQALEEQSSKLELQERFATEARLQSEFEMKNIMAQVEMAQKMIETQKPAAPPNITVQMPAPTQKKIKISRDEMGNILDLTEEAS